MDEDMLKNTNYLLSFSEAAVEDQRSSPAASFGSGGLSSFLCKFFRKNFMGRGTSPFVELVALKLHLIKVPT